MNWRMASAMSRTFNHCSWYRVVGHRPSPYADSAPLALTLRLTPALRAFSALRRATSARKASISCRSLSSSVGTVVVMVLIVLGFICVLALLSSPAISGGEFPACQISAPLAIVLSVHFVGTLVLSIGSKQWPVEVSGRSPPQAWRRVGPTSAMRQHAAGCRKSHRAAAG